MLLVLLGVYGVIRATNASASGAVQEPGGGKQPDKEP
jgi:hypothetical protein